MDSAGNLYIADVVGMVIRKVTASTGVISIVAGTGDAGYSGDKGPATSATIYYTTDGSDPTAGGATVKSYTIPITVTPPETEKAAAQTSVTDYTGSTVSQFSAIATAAYPVGSAPTVTVNAATSVTTTTANVSGTVTANNEATQYRFAYGTSSSALTKTTTKTGGLTGTNVNTVPAALTGLTAGTKYYFQLVAMNSVGTTSSQILNFTTPQVGFTRSRNTTARHRCRAIFFVPVSCFSDPHGHQHVAVLVLRVGILGAHLAG